MPADRTKNTPIHPAGTDVELWSGIGGISEQLVAYDGEFPLSSAQEMRLRDRVALADHMITLWQRFKSGEAPADQASGATVHLFPTTNLQESSNDNGHP